MSTQARQQLGRDGEEIAARHLERLGWTIVVRNHRTRHGELDIVGLDGSTLVFVEVKTRRASRSASPWDNLDPRKRKQVRAMAGEWLATAEDKPRSSALRFDAIGVVVDGRGQLVRLDHLEAAWS